MTQIYAVALAFALDCILGDPRWLPHPIVAIGKLISATERLLRRSFPATERGERAAGVLLWIIVCGVSLGVSAVVLLAARRINFWLWFALEVWFSYQILATRSLVDESMAVCRALERGDLTQSREKLAWIVGRDTQELNPAEITRAAVETVAENTTDGVIAPLLFLMIGGVPLGFLCKAVNTLDSMVGYKNEKYMQLGRFSALADDAFNFLPSRIAARLMIIAAHILRFDGRAAARIFRRDRYNHPSPNSAQTESVCAGALGIALGGGASYFGVFREKPTIGDAMRPPEPRDIRRANRLMYVTAMLALAIFAAIRAALAALI